MKRARQSTMARPYVALVLLILANAVLWLVWPDKAHVSFDSTGSVLREIVEKVIQASSDYEESKEALP